MAGSLHVRNLDDELIARLKRRAVRHGVQPKPNIGRFFVRLLPRRRTLHLRSWRRSYQADQSPQTDAFGSLLREAQGAMNTLVIDASIAVKWVVEEEGTEEALILRRRAKLVAPELLTAECANILWEKCQRDELSKDEAFLAAQLLQAADIEFLPTRLLLEAATRIAVELIIRPMTASISHWPRNVAVDLSPPMSALCVNSPKIVGAGFVAE